MRSTRSAIQIASNLYPPISVANSFDISLDGILNRFKMLVRVGVYAVLCVFWLCKNNLVFEGKNSPPLQFILDCINYIRT